MDPFFRVGIVVCALAPGLAAPKPHCRCSLFYRMIVVSAACSYLWQCPTMLCPCRPLLPIAFIASVPSDVLMSIAAHALLVDMVTV